MWGRGGEGAAQQQENTHPVFMMVSGPLPLHLPTSFKSPKESPGVHLDFDLDLDSHQPPKGWKDPPRPNHP